jgi:glycosyltransferase involved in cell wall biosynthesis
MRIEVIIPAYNEEKNIINLLECVSKATIPSDVDFHCTVVANGCTDGTYEKVSEYIKEKDVFSVIGLKEGHKAKAMNAVYKELSKDTICITIDADTTISENFVEVVYEKFLNDDDIHVLGADYVPELSNLPEDSYIRKYEIAEHVARQLSPITLPIGAFIAFKREDFVSHDSYIPLDCWRRFGKSSVLCDLSIKPIHYPATNWTELLKQRTRWVQRTVELMAKYPELREIAKEREEMKVEYFGDLKKEVVNMLLEKGLTEEEIQGLSFFRGKIVPENAENGPLLISDTGTWDTSVSTKGV